MLADPLTILTNDPRRAGNAEYPGKQSRGVFRRVFVAIPMETHEWRQNSA